MRHAQAVFCEPDRSGYDAFQFSPAVRAGPLVIVSGVIAVDGDRPFARAEDEYHAAFQKIGALLDAADASFADIVSIDSFHVSEDLIADLAVFNAVRSHYMAGTHPAWTAVTIPSLPLAGTRAEIRITAYAPTATPEAIRPR